jgi:probable F420-dependent oxidoreductase
VSAGVTPVQLSVPVRSFAADDPGDWGSLLDTARMLDAGGVDRLLVSDHVVFGEALDDYARPELGGQAGGVQPTGPDGHWLEPLTTLAVIAGTTDRIRLGTNILLAALRRPVVLAKTAATLDVLSNGRLDLGVGVGWQRAEYDAAGLDFPRRGLLLDETLEVCRTLWRERSANHDSEQLTFRDIHMMPKPRQAGGVPLWVSGTVNPRVARRIQRFGAGWIPWGPAAAKPGEGIRAMRAALTRLGHDPTTLQVAGALRAVRDDRRRIDVARTMAGVPRLVELGVTDVRLSLRLPAEPAAAEDLIGELVAAFRAAAGRAGR